jgi:lysophospholipase L1-like esterase
MISPRVEKITCIPDGIHPNKAGHERMAKACYKAIKNYM